MHYFWLVAFALAIVFQIRCFNVTKLLKNEYQMYVGGLGLKKLAEIRNGFRLKEVKYLLMKLIVAKIILYALLLTAAILFSRIYFF